jgi:hypothetical protein
MDESLIKDILINFGLFGFFIFLCFKYGLPVIERQRDKDREIIDKFNMLLILRIEMLSTATTAQLAEYNSRLLPLIAVSEKIVPEVAKITDVLTALKTSFESFAVQMSVISSRIDKLEEFIDSERRRQRKESASKGE